MTPVQITIGGNPVAFDEDTFLLIKKVNERMRLQVTILDYTGTLVLAYNELVVATDPVQGVIFVGYLIDDKQDQSKSFPNPVILHQIDTIDARVLADNRTTSRQYLTPVNTGKIVLDLWADSLQAEGINAYAGLRDDATQAQFAAGTLSGTQATLNVGNGDLELTPGGSIVTVTENTTAEFAAGTLTNVVASSNSLTPTTESAIQMTAQLLTEITPAVVGTTFIYMEIWSGSQVVGTLDTLTYDIWIDASSPAFNAGLDLNFSDSTTLHSYTGPVDQNAYPASTLTDLTTYAKGAWYTRTIGLTSALNGKTVTSVTIGVTGIKAGTYTVYVRNAYLGSHSGTPFFSTTATTTNVNPPTVYVSAGFVPVLAFASVVQTNAGAVSNRVSPAYSISAAQLVASSFISWKAATPASSGVQIAVSYDGNAFIPCANNQPLPSLPPGSKIAGTSLYFMQIFTSGTDPTILPTLFAVSVQINPAPVATKSDVVANYGTAAQWNAGTLNYLAPNASGDLTLGAIIRDWNDGLITSQPFFKGGGASSYTQSVASNAYQVFAPGGNTFNLFALSRMDFAGIQTDFIVEWDQTVTSTGGSNPFGAPGLLYRTIGWTSGVENTYGYAVLAEYGSSSRIILFYGTNTNTPSGSQAGTTLQAVPQTLTLGTTYHFKVVVTGNNHQVYFNNATTPIINVNDSTYGIGYVGFYVGGSQVVGPDDTMTFDNLSITPANSGTWLSPSTSLSSLSTIAGSTIDWLETLPSGAASATAVVQSSIDGGTTYQTCTQNTTIPGLTAGVNVSAKSLIIKITLYANSIVTEPVIGGLNWRVLGAFPTVSGSRSTAPVGNDTSITRTSASSWGTAFDGQAWTKVGTATAATGGNVATLTNTTGDVHEVLGTATITDGEITDRVMLSASGISAGVELRYVDSSHYYRLALSTTALSIVKNTGAGNVTIASTPGTYSTGVRYWLRFRVVGVCPAALSGKVWADGVIEPGDVLGVLSTTNPMWTVVGSD